ncbi:glycosyltransferase family 4 protein [Candidatus Bathyarchaeota archaeon]|nr:glycosyltransferase family 4 protein [Candidatus Bathyarchaeota archaeon]
MIQGYYNVNISWKKQYSEKWRANLSSFGGANSLDKKLLWISYLFIDKSFHKTAQIEVLRSLAKRGYQVSLLALCSDKKVRINDPDLQVTSLPMREKPILANALFVLWLLFFLPFYIMRFQPAYIIVEPQDGTAFSLVLIALLPKSKRPKIILDARTSHFIEARNSRKFSDFFFDNSFNVAKKLFDGFTTITPMMKQDFCRKYNIDPKRIGVWTSGVNIELFNPQNFARERMELRKKFGLTNKLVLFYHGSFGTSSGVGSRGIVETVESVALLKNRVNDVVLFLLGSGQSSRRIMELAQEYKIQDRVIVHNPVDYKDVPGFIAMCDVGLQPFPDRPEWRSQCSLALLEYLAMEKPVIATPLPLNLYVMGSCKCGIYVSSADPAEIAKGVMFAYSHKRELEQWGSLGKAIINRKFSWEKVAESFDEYLIQT